MYLTYDEYKAYGGTLEETAFNDFNYPAKKKLDYYTYERLINDAVFSEGVKKANYKIIGLLNTFEEYKRVVTSVTTPVVANQSNDGVSVSYGGYLGNTSPDDLIKLSEKLEKDISQTVKEYLSGERNEAGQELLYRGVYR